jgi:ribonuclease J
MAPLRIIPLGGLGEIGMNCLALEQGGEVLIVDCGVAFDDRGLGIDVVHPDFEALSSYRPVGLFLTHGHEDHIGAIPYLLKRFDMPVFGPRYALGLVRERIREHEVLGHADLREAVPGSVVSVGSFEVEPVRVTHSIADATALAIRTDAGLVVHTGDFKFDGAPPDGEMFDVARFEGLGREGVQLLLSDSTNVDSAGATGDEEGVGRVLEDMIGSASQAVVVSMFASNVHRLRMLGEIAKRTGRKLVALGRSLLTHSRVARATLRATGAAAGRPYLEWPADLVWPAERARELPRRAVLGLATGSQGEEGAALARLARGEHPSFDLSAGDLVVLSSRVIPGNEANVGRVVTDLLRRGVELRSWWSDRGVHVSGHAHREEQARMIALTQPKAFVPVHGTLRHLVRHGELAREAGVSDVCVLENGDVGELDGQPIRKAGRVQAGRVHVFGGRVVPSSVIAERSSLAERGTVHVTVPVTRAGRIAGRLALAMRGVLDEAVEGELVTRAHDEAAAALATLFEPRDDEIVDAVSRAVRRALGRVLGFRPVTLVTVLRVAS